MAAPVLDTSNDHFVRVDPEMRKQMVGQISRMNLLAISGGRVLGCHAGISLPISNGYSVTVQLNHDDTYVVRRVRTTRVKGVPVVRLYGERANVYCEDLSEVAYYASCFRSYDADEWPGKA
jgi:hypothetical protein